MATGLSAVIKSLVIDRGVSEELILQTIEDFLLAAYKRKYGTSENAVVKFDNDGDEVTLYSRKIIVDEEGVRGSGPSAERVKTIFEQFKMDLE